MIVGYYDWNESIEYPMVNRVDTNVVGFAISDLIVGASISLSADVIDAIGSDLYVAAVLRDRKGSAVITISNVPTLPSTPVFAIDFRVNVSQERFVVVPGVFRGSMVNPRVAAFLVVAGGAFVADLPPGQPLTFSASTLLDPSVLRVSDRGNVSKISVIKSVKRADVAVPYVDGAAPAATPLVLDQLSGFPVDVVTLSPAGAQYQLVGSNGTTYVAMPMSIAQSVTVQTPQYATSIQPTIFVGRTSNQSTRGVTGVPLNFKFDDWINDPSIFNVLINAVVYIDGVQSTIGGPNGISKANLHNGFSYAFSTPGTHLVSIAATKSQLVGLLNATVSFITFSATIVVTDDAAYFAPQGVVTPTAQPAMGSVAVPSFTLSSTSLMVEKHSTSRPLLPQQTLSVVLGGSYDTEDATAWAAIPEEVLTLVAESITPIFVAGKNFAFAFATARNTVTPGIRAGAHIKLPYIGYAVPGFVACNGALRTLFGANPDKDGNITIIAGAGVTVIPEPAMHRITVVIEDPRAALSGKSC